MDFLHTIFHFLIEWLVVGVIWKVIVAHALADYIVKYTKLWLAAKPHRQEHYESMLHYHRSRMVE